MGGWAAAIDCYSTWLAAGGRTAGTINQRRHYLQLLARQTPNPWTATGDELVRFVACDRWGLEARKSARATVQGFYRWALATERIRRDPSVILPAVRVPAGEPRPAPDDVLADAITKASQRDRLMLMLAALQGMRCAEIAAVHFADLERDAIRVTGKGGRVRVLPLHPDLADELRRERRGRMLGQHTEGQRFAPSDAHGWLFPGQSHGHITPGAVSRILSRLMSRGWAGHTLRHRFATATHDATRDLIVVQRLLGHASVVTTQRYTAVSSDRMRDAVHAVRLPTAA